MNDSKKMAALAYRALEDKKAKDISILGIGKISVIADYFLIATGDNERQVQALADHVDETLGRAGFEKRSLEGYHTSSWILMDFNDVIVHIFNREDRNFYDLDRIWREAERIDISALENE